MPLTGPGASVVASPYRDPAHGRPDLYEQFRDLGVHHHTAGKLLREHDHLQIEQIMEHVTERLQQGWTPQQSVAAWLVAAIRGQYQLPSQAPHRREADEQLARRQEQAAELAERERERSDEELRRGREARLATMGIEQNVDKTWQVAQALLRERDQWSALMALSYLKNIENGLAVLLVPGALHRRLELRHPEIEAALAEVTGGPVRLVVNEMG